MRWGSPDLLNLLWLVPLLAWVVFFLLRRRERQLGSLVDAKVLPQLAPERHRPRIRSRNILWLAAVGLSLLALARPQWGFHWEEVRRRGLDILVVLDTSKSMLAEDIKPDRLQQAKWGIRDLLGKLRGDRIGVVAFAGSSFLQCPLTIDYAAFLMTLDDVYVGIIPRGGTAITQALRKAIESFEMKGEADRAIILITDGEDHEGNPLGLINDMKEKNIRVYAVGVGTLEGELIPANEENAGSGFIKDKQGNVVKSSLQESVLERLAIGSGGVYVRSAPGDFGLDRVFDKGIAELKRDERESKMAKVFEERFAWPLGLAFLLLGIEAVLGERARRNGGAS
jgi:Ca-activated chloride channel homolog